MFSVRSKHEYHQGGKNHWRFVIQHALTMGLGGQRKKRPHSPARRTFRDNGAEGQQRLLPTEMRKKTLLAFDELERLHHTHDVSVNLLRRQHFAVGDDDN